jgi:hypothetical protein
MALTPAEKQQRYRDRKKLQEGNVVTVDEAVVVTEEELEGPPEIVPPRPRTARTLTEAARAGEIELTDGEEQFIRDCFGYSPTEKRSLAQRDEAASRMLSQALPPFNQDAFPAQPGDLAPTAEERAKLG